MKLYRNDNKSWISWIIHLEHWEKGGKSYAGEQCSNTIMGKQQKESLARCLSQSAVSGYTELRNEKFEQPVWAIWLQIAGWEQCNICLEEPSSDHSKLAGFNTIQYIICLAASSLRHGQLKLSTPIILARTENFSPQQFFSLSPPLTLGPSHGSFCGVSWIL